MNQNAMAAPSKYKTVFLGDQSVGKTSILNRFMYDTFDGGYQATIGIDFLSKTLHSHDKMLRLQLWDTAGQERFKSLIPSYIKDSSVAVVVYDITNKASFDSVNRWIEDARQIRGEDVIIFLVGNKVDQAEKRQVGTDEGKSKAEQLDVGFIESSAKAGINIKQLFQLIGDSLIEPQNAGTGTSEAEQHVGGAASGGYMNPSGGLVLTPANPSSTGQGEENSKNSKCC